MHRPSGYDIISRDGPRNARPEDLPLVSISTPQSSKSHIVSSKQRMKVKSQPSWPTGPRPLVKYDGLGWLSLVGDILVTLSPLVFLVLGISALNLDGKPRSRFGENLIEASKYGTTAFPIIFAAVAARMMRALALKFSERGATLGVSSTKGLPMSHV